MGECYAELGMTDVADNAGWQTCLFIPGFCNFVVGDGTGGTEQYIMETATAAECVNTVLEYHPEGKERYSTDYRVTNLPLLVRAGQSRRASPASFALGCLGCSKIVASRFARTNGCHEFWQSTAR